MDLLLSIARCPIVKQCLALPDQPHPSREIVLTQGTTQIEHHQVPEPWSGHLERAPILFLSSNPSISFSEDYPVSMWDDPHIVDFFDSRFTGTPPRIKDGIYGRERDGTYSRKGTRFWIGVRARAAELMQRPAVPGEDYALTEIVHCKSVREIGVASARTFCADRYLQHVIASSGARVIVCLGRVAKNETRRVFDLPHHAAVAGPIVIGSRARIFAMIPHPTSWEKAKTFAGCLTPEALTLLRAFLRTPTRRD